MEILEEIDFAKNDGLVTAIAQDHSTGEVLMVAFMNEEAFRLTVETGAAGYWSRSRKKLWHKGEESGNTQKLKSLYIDCDGDAVLMTVEQIGGAACRSGEASPTARAIASTIWQ